MPVLDATPAPASLSDVRDLLQTSLGGVMIKAVAGGGGRGIRPVTRVEGLDEAYRRCQSEAVRAFGSDEVFAERLVQQAKHIEVQVLGDGTGQISVLGERECSIQRRRQKLIEYAPSPAFDDSQRHQLYAWARHVMSGLKYRGLATVEFLVDAESLRRGPDFDAVFIEVNPRVQVEHTVTEEVTGVDLIAAQLCVANDATLAQLELDDTVDPRPGVTSIQARLNAERIVDGHIVATRGTVERFEPPAGVRVDAGIGAGSVIDGTFDSLLAKIVTVSHGDFAQACHDAREAVAATALDGVETNRELLCDVLNDPRVTSGEATVGLVDHILSDREADETASQARYASAERYDVIAGMDGTVVAIDQDIGEAVTARSSVVTLESMKMEHPVPAPVSGAVLEMHVRIGDQVSAGHVLARIDPSAAPGNADNIGTGAEDTQGGERADLAELHSRVAATRDAARPKAVDKRHATGHLTAREWVAELTDSGSFIEYGSLPVAAQRSRRSLDDLRANTPADGIITGFGTVTSDGTSTQCAILAYDYMVLAGTQGYFNHQKTDRVLEQARDRATPVIFFTEGGGGRPGDTDTRDLLAAGLTVPTFATMGSLSGQVPTIGIATGRCFAGNAALLACCDVIIATEDANIGMAGPAMIEGGGLGTFRPEDIGPVDVQATNGVIDVRVEDGHAAITAAKQYLSYFQGSLQSWTVADQQLLRDIVPENRKRIYEMRELIETLADNRSVLELRKQFGTAAITALIRIEGRPYGLIANDPRYLGGAIDADAADKMARFLQLCDAHGLGVVSLCDTPGFMVGPESEKTATVRHFGRLFVTGSHLRIPIVTVVTRKGYGLGAQAMAAGGFHQTTATIAWPTGEIGGMGLEGAVRLGYSKELDVIDDPDARTARYEELVDEHYEAGKATSAATTFELDEVIDPADTRRWIASVLGESGLARDDVRDKRFIDTW